MRRLTARNGAWEQGTDVSFFFFKGLAGKCKAIILLVQEVLYRVMNIYRFMNIYTDIDTRYHDTV